MSLRLIEVYIDREKADELGGLLEGSPVLGTWEDRLSGGLSVRKLLVRSEDTDEVLGTLEDGYSAEESFRAVILEVEATLPRPPEPEETEETDEEKEEKRKKAERLGVEELYQKLMENCACDREFLVMTFISSVVAGLGLIHNDMVVVIGSMVIAPLLGPNMALSMATSLGDIELVKRSLRSSGAGIVIALGIGTAMGYMMDVDPAVRELTSRSDVSHYYIALALATGVAGSYSITTGVSQAMVGVMVAVALLPPLVASGLFLGSGNLADSSGAMLMFLVNLASVNLAGVVTFLFQGIRPRKWWEAEKAKKGVVTAIALWGALLALLAVIILFESDIKRALTYGG